MIKNTFIKEKADVYSILLFFYLLISVYISFSNIAPHVSGIAISFLVIGSAMKWGLKAGIASAFISSLLLVNIMVIQDFDAKYITPSILAFFIAAAIVGYSRDILFNNREKIKRSEKKYRSIVENTNDGILFNTFRGEIIDFNERCYRMLGYEKEEFLNLTYFDVIHPEEVNYFDKKIKELLAKKQVIFEARHRCRDGSYLATEVSVVIASEEGDGVIQSFIRDITERKIYEAELLRSHRLITVLNSIDALIYVADIASDEILFLNDKAKEQWGNVMGLKCSELTHKNQVSPHAFCEESNLVDEKGSPRDVFEWEKYNDNLQRWFLYRDRAIYWVDGSLVRMQIINDITEQKMAEEMLRRSHERLVAVMNSIKAMIFVVDGDTREILFANEAAANEWGDIIGKSCCQTSLQKSEENCLLCRVAPEMNGKKELREEVSMDFFHNESQRWLEKRTIAFNWIDGRKAYLSIINDISDRKKRDEESYRVKLLKSIEEEKTVLARDLHDEIGMSLTVVKLELQILHKKVSAVDKDLKKKVGNSIKTINKSLERVRSKSTFLRPPALEDMGLIAVLEDLLEDFKRQTLIDVSLKTSAKKTDFPIETETVLYRCIQETLTNIARHSSAVEAFIKIDWNNESVFVTIKDNGRGFDLKILETTESLGIRGIRERVFLLGGSFDISSAPGQGVDISINIPFEN